VAGIVVIHVRVETPVKLTGRQKELMRELAASWEGAASHHPRHQGFFDKAKSFWEDVTGRANTA
jgi:molecular chaperone DnaJ